MTWLSFHLLSTSYPQGPRKTQDSIEQLTETQPRDSRMPLRPARTLMAEQCSYSGTPGFVGLHRSPGNISFPKGAQSFHWIIYSKNVLEVDFYLNSLYCVQPGHSPHRGGRVTRGCQVPWPSRAFTSLSILVAFIPVLFSLPCVWLATRFVCINRIMHSALVLKMSEKHFT